MSRDNIQLTSRDDNDDDVEKTLPRLRVPYLLNARTHVVVIYFLS